MLLCESPIVTGASAPVDGPARRMDAGVGPALEVTVLPAKRSDSSGESTVFTAMSSESFSSERESLASGLSCSQRSPILKHRTIDASTIDESKQAWKCLPPPDLGALVGNASSASTCTETTALDESLSTPKSVGWGTVEIRSYSQTISYNPAVSYGVAIQLDWDYEVSEAIDIMNYETNRGVRRNLMQMALSYYHRKNVLSWQYGHSKEEIKAAKKSVERAKLKQSITLSLLPCMRAEEAVESARRKAKRYLCKTE